MHSPVRSEGKWPADGADLGALPRRVRNRIITKCRTTSHLAGIYLRIHPREPQIFIKTLTGRKQAFNFEPENQVLAVKQALQEKEGIQVDQIRLIYSGKQLADDKTLDSYNIAAGATIHMVLQLRGGNGASY